MSGIHYTVDQRMYEKFINSGGWKPVGEKQFYSGYDFGEASLAYCKAINCKAIKEGRKAGVTWWGWSYVNGKKKCELYKTIEVEPTDQCPDCHCGQSCCHVHACCKPENPAQRRNRHRKFPSRLRRR